MRRSIVALSFLVGALFALLGTGPAALAQDASPVVEPAPTPPPALGLTLRDKDGQIVGSATFNQGADGIVTVVITAEGLAPGEHGVHVHETGICDPSGDKPFSSAGGHFNPAGAHHGGPPAVGEAAAMATPVAEGGHAGDLGNLTADDQGNVRFEIKTDRFTLSPGPASLNDADGSALVIHADPDDLTTDPSGNSGDRIACGVVFAPTEPMGTPEATPTT